ncbi:uncharacterized protein BCR38DRAFT_107520 [Pseudomassariella vexata]|uniref:GYF domain-containing protein n=1 Tax=Pseudomassariella vexata TaxID=1141098 RepID=A0A1Y2EFY7_9PEZI|nr:uncharacterized protein BCR38DRAFT_107520 [Pseudomassariella vexata]ORY70492.1 hypothetical protein BCR38DRAFT_107520 [Pseudomassariella vexata]
MPGWSPGQLNGNSGGTRGWGNRIDSHAPLPQQPDVCWDATGSSTASILRELTSEEKDRFSSDVNSPVKPPPLQNKDGNHVAGALNGRKTSVSHGAPNNFSLASPSSASRPGTRRRETTDTNPYSGGGGLTSPTATTPSSSWFGRKHAEVKETMFEEPEENPNLREGNQLRTTANPFGGLIRSNTTSGNSAIGATASLWGQPTGATSSIAGIGSFGNFAIPSSSAIGEKRPGNTRGESRLAHLIPKDSSDNMAARANETSAASWRAAGRPRTDTDPFGGEESLSGSAVLGGAQDTSPPSMSHQSQRNQAFDTPVKGSAGDFGMAGLNLLNQPTEQDNQPLSPSETNPYASPPGERGEGGDEAADRSHGHGFGGTDHAPGFGGGVFPRPLGPGGFDGSDRSQTSSVGPRAYPSIGNGNLSGWPTSATPDRERSGNLFGGAFGSSLFGGDVHSPSLSHFGGVFGPPGTTGLAPSGSIGRGSRLGSLFPPAMQAQMQGHETESLSDSSHDLRQTNPLGAIGRNTFGDHTRDTGSPMRGGRGMFDELIAAASRPPATSESTHGGITTTSQAQDFPQSSGTPFNGTQSSDPQARTMVMPDRMRWVYLDPVGRQQGPFTGLEMNDWYKANFFSPDLRVKKVEDSEFEPLGQLIRRIGNSREPFLVPQIGIPHGPPAQTGPFSPNASGAVQPPLVGAFPSFGRTLTAQEQNDLERRKQEEQYLMAQQRDLLSNQRMARISHPGLHHASSAHSLQSQPSFGSMTSPITMPPQAPIGPIGGAAPFFGGHPPNHQPAGQGSGFDMLREDEFARLSDQERQVLTGVLGPGAPAPSHSQAPIGAPSSDLSFRSRLPGTEELVEDSEGFRGRLQEFEQIRAQRDAQLDQSRFGLQGKSAEQSPPPTSSPTAHHTGEQSATEETLRQTDDDSESVEESDTGSLNRQIQQAQAQAAAAAKISGLPLPFPPPQSSTPLPAPAPQRVKSNLPEQYATSSRSETPEITPSSSSATHPPPLAPWAEKAVGSRRGPTLKEIQEAEAKKAAKAEEQAAAVRRAMADQEAAREREKAAAIASGLPTTSTWGTASPVGSSASPWAKPAAPGIAAPKVPVPAADKKKTLADIQREEEARKLKADKAKQMAAQLPGTPSAAGLGKRYADLASKPNAPGFPTPAPAVAGVPAASAAATTVAAVPPPGWSTVGAGGKAKVKIPTGPAAAQPRTPSAVNVKPVTSPGPVAKPAVKTTGVSSSEAMDEFNKWVQSQLTRGITGVTDINIFQQTLMELPAEASIIADAVYANSKTMDGRHFAAEFIRRRKLAEKGVVEKQGTTDVLAQSAKAGGWNEVAKKSTHKENNGGEAALPAGFKVVNKKKGGKK